MRPQVNIIERIERHLPERLNDDDCWITDLAANSSGYVYIGGEGSAPKRRLHRVVWEAHNAEPIPKGMVIHHTCDNRACCNPHHLRLVTQKENIADADRKGRRPHIYTNRRS